MSSASEWGGRTARALALLAGLAALVAAGPAAAQALGDRYWIEVSAFRPSIDTSASVSRTGQAGTVIDFESDLGLDDTDTLPAAYGGFRLGERWMVQGEYYGFDRDGSRTLTRDIVFDGATYPSTVQVASQFRSDIYRLSLGYAFWRNETSEVGASVGLHATNFELGLQGQARVGSSPTLTTEHRAKDFLAPMPTIGLYGTYEVTPKVVLNGRVDYLSLGIGDYDGGILHAEAAVAYRLTDLFSVGAAYRYVGYDLTVNKENYTADLEYDFSGPSLFVRMTF